MIDNTTTSRIDKSIKGTHASVISRSSESVDIKFVFYDIPI